MACNGLPMVGFFVVSFLICFKSLCWEGVKERLQICWIFWFCLFRCLLACCHSVALCSLDTSVQDLPEFHFLGFEAHLRGGILLVLCCDFLSRDMRENGTFCLKKIFEVDGFTVGCSIIGNSAASKFLMKRELLTNCCR